MYNKIHLTITTPNFDYFLQAFHLFCYNKYNMLNSSFIRENTHRSVKFSIKTKQNIGNN